MSNKFRQLENETTAKWLARLVGIDAPQDVRADVRAILESEKGKKSSSVFIHRIHLVFVVIILCFLLVLISCR